MFVRAPHAHADIVSIDAAAARRRPGVLAVLTGADYVADGHIGIGASSQPRRRERRQDSDLCADAGCKILDLDQLPLAVGRVRYVGEAVAVVVAETLAGCARRRRGGRGRVPTRCRR